MYMFVDEGMDLDRLRGYSK